MHSSCVARVACCPAVAQGLAVERKLLLALAGLVLTLILAQPCEGAVPGNGPLDSPEKGNGGGIAWARGAVGP